MTEKENAPEAVSEDQLLAKEFTLWQQIVEWPRLTVEHRKTSLENLIEQWRPLIREVRRRDIDPLKIRPPWRPKISRTAFVEAYAKRSNLDPKYARLGMIDTATDHPMMALPCDCGEEECEGWAMLSANGALDHLFFRAPEEIRSAYHKCLQAKPVAGEACGD